MNKIVFKISKNNISVALYTKELPKTNLNNTNVIDTKEIVFSENYINENLDLVSSFLNVIIIKRNVNALIVKDFDLTLLALKIIKNIPNIEDLVIKEDKIITYSIFLSLLDNKYLKNIEVYDIPFYLLERLDINKDINIKVRSEILFLSNFMNDNDLNTYSDIFYKKKIIIENIDENDYEELNTFFEINKNVKAIEFNYFNEKLFDFVFKKIIDSNRKNIKIIFNEERIELKELFRVVNKYKKTDETLLEDNNITFKVNYSDEYKKNNLFKQINFSFIKVTLIGIILVVGFMISINFYRNLKDNEKYDTIEKEIYSILKETEIPDVNYQEPEFIEPEGEEKDRLTETATTIYDLKYEKVFEKLLALNDDTVGWLTVNNTNIDYPVVQYSDNDYYLKKDYYKNKNRHGWIFMDYRNNIEDLSSNTIIYGHNLANQKMFGTLRYALNEYWYKKTNNQIITFNTLNENMKWQIFSIYKVPVTTDYLVSDFGDDQRHIDFINLIKNRSIYDFNQNVDVTDKILTLSTCSNGFDQRLVIHAKLIKEN